MITEACKTDYFPPQMPSSKGYFSRHGDLEVAVRPRLVNTVIPFAELPSIYRVGDRAKGGASATSLSLIVQRTPVHIDCNISSLERISEKLVAGGDRVLGEEVDGLVAAVLGVHGSPVVAALLVIVDVQTFDIRSGHDQNLGLLEEGDMRGNGRDLNIGTIILLFSNNNLPLNLSHGPSTNGVIMINIKSIGEDTRQTRHRDGQEALVSGSSDMEHDGVGEHWLPRAIGAISNLA